MSEKSMLPAGSAAAQNATLRAPPEKSLIETEFDYIVQKNEKVPSDLQVRNKSFCRQELWEMAEETLVARAVFGHAYRSVWRKLPKPADK